MEYNVQRYPILVDTCPTFSIAGFLCYTFPSFHHDRLATCTVHLGLLRQTRIYGGGVGLVYASRPV